MFHYHIKNTIFLIIPVIIISCKKDTSQPVPPPLPEKSILNEKYGTGNSQSMDIYLPAGRTESSTKVLILIHGGAWEEGDKNDFATTIDTIKKRLPGWAIFNINYRLASNGSDLFPTQENDVRSAIDSIYKRRSQYSVSDKFVLLGASAGAHLALLHAYKKNGLIPVKAVVDFFGPTDLKDMYDNPANPLIPLVLIRVTGTTPYINQGLFHDSSPIHYVTSQTPPTILLHGGADAIVSYSQSVALNTKLETAGVAHQYVFYPSENHGWAGANLSDSFDKIVAFINSNVH